MINAKLVVVGGTTECEEIKLGQLPAVLGRGRSVTVTLPHPLVSRRHCELFELNGRLMVRDLGSTNGTFVGSERIAESLLGPGELLTIGTVTFRAIYGDMSDDELDDDDASATWIRTRVAQKKNIAGPGTSSTARDTSNVARDSSPTRADVANPLEQPSTDVVRPTTEETLP